VTVRVITSDKYTVLLRERKKEKRKKGTDRNKEDTHIDRERKSNTIK
jgi:hypothetical protein